MAASSDDRPFVSRAGAKLAHALDAFDFDVTGLACADFGCNVGGFTDCLLQRGAASVVAIDTGYGTLDWRLRSDDRVVVRERTNALHAEPPEDPVDLVVVDMGWTRQRLAIPAALRWLGPGGRIVSLVKPHYEAEGTERKSMQRGRLEPDVAEAACRRTLADLEAAGLVLVRGLTRSPITGGKSSRKGPGNIEFLAWLEPAGSAADTGVPGPSAEGGTDADRVE